MRKILATLAAVALALVLTGTLTGCHVGPPCDNHGGVSWTNAKIYQCADGTWE